MRVLNLRLTAILLTIVVVFVVGVYFLHDYQVHRNAYVFMDASERAVERAEEAAKARDVRKEKEEYKNAIKSLSWYVWLEPEDIDALEKLGMMLADRADSPRMFAQAFGRLENVLRKEPDRTSARRRLVDMAMLMRHYQGYQAAKEHLEGFLLKDSPDDPELLDLYGQCCGEMGETDKALESFKKAIKIAPDQVEIYPRLARLLRVQFSNAKEADQVMTDLVAKNPESYRAHFLRGGYLKNFDANEEALKEAERALELAPGDREVLLLNARCCLAMRDVEKARQHAARGIELFPDNIDMYTTMADIELQAGSRDKAIASLQQGLKATERSPQLLWSMGNLLIDVNSLDEAEQLIKELKTTEIYKPFIEYLAARIDFVKGRWLPARVGFEKVRGALAIFPHLQKQMDVWIGQCYGQLGNRDAQVDAYRRALKADPFYAPARAGLTEAMLASGNVNDALDEYRKLASSGRLGAGGLIPYARMLILQNLRLAPTERDWGPAEKALQQAEEAKVDSAQIPILRAEILVAQNRQDEAEKLLQEAREANPDQRELWTVLASLAERQQDWTKTEALLEESKKAKGDTVENRLAEAQYLVRRKGKDATDELHKLAENDDRFTDPERLSLWNGLLNAAMQVDDRKQARVFAQRIADKEPNNVQVRYMLFEQALQANPPDFEGMDKALKEIEGVAGQGAYWLYGQAVRMSLQAKDQPDADAVLDKALEYLKQAGELRQSWSRVPLLMAGIYDQQGKTDLALKSYREAIELGEHNPGAVRRAVQILSQKQQYEEAGALLRELEKQQMPFSPEMSRAGAEVALRQGEFDRALEMARKGASTESKNYQEHLWLGQVLGIVGRRAKSQGKASEAADLLASAEASLRRAVELEPGSPETWVSLIQFFSANGAMDQAETAIEGASTSLSPQQAPLTLAQCYEAMKKPEAAEEKYEAALAAAPQDPRIVRFVADFYCRSSKPVPAEALLRRIIDGKVESPDADKIWARRQLALIYAGRGGYQNIQKARDLIEENIAASAGDAATLALDRRVEASLNASDPTQAVRDDAIAALETMRKDGTATPEDLFKLAQMYQTAGAWMKASDVYRSLVGAYGNEPRYMATYITALLAHGEISNAETYLERLESIFPNHIITVGLRAEVLVAKNEPKQALELLRAFIDKSDAQPPDRSMRIRLAAEKIEQLAQRQTKPAQKEAAESFLHQAEMFYRAFADVNSGQDWVLIAFLGRQGRFDDALDMLDRNWDGGNPVAISQVSSILLRDGKISKEQQERLNRILQSALKKFDRPVPLLMVMADLCTKQARYADAEGFYRDILEKNSGNAYAMNNLAVLLALQGIKSDEALKLIDKAVELAGPVAAMLDSRATVYLALNEPDKALADMNNALAEGETQVRLFHLAQAYELAGQQSAAVDTMKKALETGLTKEMLQPLEVPAFDKLVALTR